MSQVTRHRWNDLTIDNPMPMLVRQRVIGENMMISRITLQRGCVVPVHAHENEQFSIIVSGKLRFRVHDTAGDPERIVDVGPGEILMLPPNSPHGAEALEDTVALDVFSPPSQTTGVDIPRR